MRDILGLDIGNGLIKIAAVRSSKVYKTAAIEFEDGGIEAAAYRIRQFVSENALEPSAANIIVKDYKTRRIRIERVRNSDLKNALLFEREEKIGPNDILGENYKDNHVIQKKTNNMLDILLAVVNEEEIRKAEEVLEAAGITGRRFFMECFLYNDIMGDNSVIIDIGHSSVQLMFFDKKKVMKTSLLKKGIKDIIAELKEKTGSQSGQKEIEAYSFDNKSEAGEIISTWLSYFADNIISGINTYVRENSRDITSMNIFYTGGIFSIPRMVDYLNYLMSVEGRILKGYSQKEDPVFCNSIALAFKTGSKGRINRGGIDIATIAIRIAPNALLTAATALAVLGLFNLYQFFILDNKAKAAESIYQERKSSYSQVCTSYNEINSLLSMENSKIKSNTESSDISKVLSEIRSRLAAGTTIEKLEFKTKNTIVIEGSSKNYTSLGIFCAQLRKVLKSVNIRDMQRDEGKDINYRLECMF